MGLYAMRWAFGAPIKNAGAKFLLVALAEHARDDGEDGWTCFASIKRLSKRTSQGERTIERHMSWLMANGWISRQIRRDRRQFFRRSGVNHPPISTVSPAKLASRYIEEPVIEPLQPEARFLAYAQSPTTKGRLRRVAAQGAPASAFRLSGKVSP